LIKLKKKGFRLLCLIGFIAVVQCDFGHQKGGGSSYGAPPPAPVSSYGAPIASGYGVPPAPSGYGVPAPSYGAVPSYEPVHYEKDKVRVRSSALHMCRLRNLETGFFFLPSAHGALQITG